MRHTRWTKFCHNSLLRSCVAIDVVVGLADFKKISSDVQLIKAVQHLLARHSVLTAKMMQRNFQESDYRIPIIFQPSHFLRQLAAEEKIHAGL